MDTAKAPGDGGSPSAPRVAVWAVGWAVALAGALSTFSVPMYISVVLLLAGSLGQGGGVSLGNHGERTFGEAQG